MNIKNIIYLKDYIIINNNIISDNELKYEIEKGNYINEAYRYLNDLY